MIIKEVSARKIKDSRGDETIEVSVNGSRASSPSGKSRGKYETPSYRENIDWNIAFLNSWNEADGKKLGEINSFYDLEKVEEDIKKSLKINDVKKFGANAIFAFESAILKALVKEQRKELWQIINPKARKLPFPAGNAVGGGLHSSNKGKPSFQEFLVIPRASNFSKNYDIMKDFYKKIGRKFKSKKTNDEGAWEVSADEESILKEFDSLRNELEKKLGENIGIGVDAATSTFFKSNSYYYKDKSLDKSKQIKFASGLIKKYKILYFEDPLNEDDFTGFYNLKKEAGGCLIVGDDLTATSLDRLKRALEIDSVNAVIVKPNQNGSLLEMKKIFEFCKLKGIKTIMSHRSGETMDDALADYTFGFQADFFKCGIVGPERESKIKRLIEIQRG